MLDKPMPPLHDLDRLLERHEPPIGALIQDLMGVLHDVRPDLKPAVKLGWGSVNYTHAKAGYVCAVFPTRTHVALVFENGRLLDSPLLVDDGKVRRVRWIPLAPGDELPIDDIAILIAEAIALKA
jgi:hypothetical protein